MAAGVTSFKINDISYPDNRVVINGHLFTTTEALNRCFWQANDDVTLMLTQYEGIYKVKNLLSKKTLFFQVVGEPKSLLDRGDHVIFREGECQILSNLTRNNTALVIASSLVDPFGMV